MNQYYIMIRGEWRGPVDVDEIERLFDAGEIGTRTLYSKEGWSQGREVGEILASRGRRDHAWPTEKPVAQKKGTSPVAILLLVFLGGIALLCMIGGIAGSGGSGERSRDRDAHYTAEQFIMKQYPGAKSVSSYSESVVQHDGDTYTVAVTVDGLNAFGGPVRKQVGVQMELSGGKWRLVHMEQR